MCSLTWKLLETHILAIFVETCSYRHDQLLTLLSAPLPSVENGGRAENSVSDHGLVFLVVSPHPGATQEPSQSRLLRTKDTAITQEIASD